MRFRHLTSPLLLSKPVKLATLTMMR